MSVLYIMLPAALLVALAGVVAFIRAARSGQYDDLETPAHRVLEDDNALNEPFAAGGSSNRK